MATNLRLRPEVERALRAEAQRSGRSQQEVIRAALDHYLGLAGGDVASAPDAELRRLGLCPPRMPFREATTWLELPPGVTTADLLDRDDRF